MNSIATATATSPETATMAVMSVLRVLAAAFGIV
jgi:hypothetical protein